MTFDPDSAVPDAPFDPSTAVPESAPPVRAVLQDAVKVNPDKAARAGVLARERGLPDQMVLRNLADIEFQAAVDKADEKLKTSPKLLTAMRTRPEIAPLMHDDIGPLSQVEMDVAKYGALKAWNGPEPTVKNILSGLAQSFPQGAKAAKAGLDAQMTDFLEWAGLVTIDPIVKADRARKLAQATGASSFTTPDFESTTAGAIYGGVSSTIRMIPGLAATLATRSPAPMLAAAGLQSEAEAYGKYKGRGASGVAAFSAAMGEGAVEVATEMLPTKFLADSLGKTGIGEFLVGLLAREIPGEQVATLLQDAIDTAVANPDKTWGEYLAERPEAAYSTLVSTLTQTALMSGVNGAVRRLAGNADQGAVAEEDAQKLTDLLKTAASSALRERSPEQFRALMGEMTEGKIYIDGEVLNQLSPEVIATLPQAVQDQIAEAAAANSTVEIPVADILTLAPGTPLEQVIIENARSEPGAMSQADAKQAASQAQELLAAEAERVIAQAADQDVFRASSDAVKSTILAELNTAARYRPAVNEGMATWATAFYTTMASRVGMTPEEFYAAHKLRILGEPSTTAAGPVMDQGKPGEVAVEGYHFSAEDRPTLTTGAFGTGLRGSARDEIMNHPDKRLKERLSFYVDLGNGIVPESGVGGRAHRAQLANVYDSDLDPLKLRSGDARAFEAKVLDAGYSGYLSRMGGASQGQVVMLGQQAIRPELLGAQSRITNGQRPPALPRVAPTWQTQASGDPAMLQAKLEKMQASPSWAAYDLRIEGRELQSMKREEVLEQSVSSRVPWAKPRGKNPAPIENPLTERLQVDIAAFKDVPDALDNAVALLVTYPNYRPAWRLRSTESKVERFIAEVKANLLWLHDLVPAEIRERSKLWYDGANVIANDFAERYGVSLAQASAVLAVNSPQTEWFTNVSRAERILDIWFNQQDFRWSDEMEATATEILSKYPDELDEIRGKTLGELSGDSTLQAMWLRTFDQSHNDRAHRLVTPEGTFGEWVTNSDGVTKSKTAWASFGHIAKSLEVIQDGSIENVSLRLGNEHKVRSFYNNIFSPTDPVGDVTIDTHAVAAGLLRPLAGSDIEVGHNLGGGVSNALKGLSGTYGIYAEAYRQAAAERGILPREMQSITWEAVRGLYTDTFKSSAKAEEVEQAWRDFRAGKLDEAGVRARVMELSGGINEPNWWQSDRRPPTETWSSSYGGDLSPVRLRGSTADTPASGDPAGSGAGGGAGKVLNQAGGVDGQAGNRAGRYSSGGLAPLEGAPAVAGATGPDPRLVAVAEQYAADNGIDLRRQGAYATVDPERAARIAAAYEAMPHAPNDPAVREAYDDMLRQTTAQYLALQAAGYKFWFMDPGADPYQGNPWNAMRDLRANQSMAVFPTEAGFGSGGQVNIGLADPNGGPNIPPEAGLEALRIVGAEVEASAIHSSDTEPTLVVKLKKALTKEQGDFLSGLADQEAIAQRTDNEKGALFGPMAEKWGPFNPTYFVTPAGVRADEIANPLLADTGITWAYGSPDGEQRPVLANDLFRAVHDAFGHGLEGAGFRAQGEENAWQAHRGMFTGPALGALTSETRGQNSWLNYGPHGKTNQTAKVEDTVFAEQKTGLMPEWTWTEGVVEPAQDVLEQEPQQPRGTFNPRTLELVLNPNANLSTFFHETGHFFLEVMADIASQPGAPAQIVEDMATFLKWAGITGDETVGGADSGVPLAQQDVRTVADFDKRIVAKTDKWNLRRQAKAARVAVKAMPFGQRKKVEQKYGFSLSGDFIEDIAAVETALAQAALGVSGYNVGQPKVLSDNGQDAYPVAAGGGFIQVLPDVSDTDDVRTLFVSAVAGVQGQDVVNAALAEARRAGLGRVFFGPETGVSEGEVGAVPRSAEKNFAARARAVAATGYGNTDPADFAARAKRSAAALGERQDSAFVVGRFIDVPGAILAQEGTAPDAPPVQRKRTALETWNAMTLDQKRQFHERWAESIEQYVMEGNAPSVELQPLMRRFATWLKSVYGSIQKMLAARPDAEQTPLNDDIRRVMDRMLATDEQIAQANEVAGLVPDVDADALAAERLNKRSMADLKWAVKARDQVISKLRKQAAAIEKEIRAEVTVEVDQTPEMRAKRALDALTVSPEFAGMLAEHKAARKAAETTVRDEVKAALLADNPDAKGLVKGQLLMKNKRDIDNKVESAMIKWDAANPAPKRPVNQTDADVATIADSFGYETVDAMLQAVDAYGPRKAAIEGLTDQRMLEEHGDLVDERAIMEAANEAVHNEARARSLATELRTQREMLNPRTDTGETNAKGSKITVNALVEAAKQFGANVVSRTVLRDLKAKVWQHTAAERRAGKAWQEATAKGDTTAAVKAKQDQVLNNAAAKAAIDARAEAAKIFDFFKRVTKGNDETVVEKGRDADMVNAARAVLAAYGVQSSASKGAAEYLDKVAKNDPETYNVIKPMVDGALLNAQPLDALTFEELQALHEEVQAIWFLAKRIRQMEVDGDLMDVEDAAAEVYARLEEIGIPDTVPGETGALTRAEETARRWLQQVPALGRRVEQWAEGKDGKFGGPFLRFLFNPVKDAADKYRTARLEYRKKFEVLVSAIAPSMHNELIAAPELGYTFGRGHNGIGTAELLHAILHTGNESNKRKLLLGRGWATDNGDGTMDTTKWDTFVARLVAEGKLTKAHYDFAQGVWDLLEQTKPLAQQTHRAVFGRYFAEVTADSFVTPFGTYRGGYVPAQADPALVQDADLRELLETENAGMSQAFPATNKGFTKSRVEYNRPLKLDLRTLGQHIDKVLLFSHMEPAVRGAAKLLRQKNVAQPLARVDPAAMGGMLKPWLNRSARQTVETPIAGDAGLNRLASTIRGRVGMALMFANVSNTLQQLTGFLPASLRVKPALMLRAAAQFIRHPKQMRESVWALSPYMADRASNEVAVLSDTMEKILIDPSVYERAEMWTRQHGYFLQTAFDNVMSPIIWSAAYNHGVAEGMDERLAIRFADGTIRQTQGSTLAEDVSRIETGPAYARLFTQFIGYFNMVANTNATALQQIAAEQGLKKGAGKAFGVVMLGLLAPIWVAEGIAHAMRGGPDDEDDDGYLDDWMAAVFGFGTIRGILSGVPFIGAAAQSAVNRFNDQPADDKFSLSPTVSVLESAVGSPASVYKAIVNDGNAQKAVRDVSALITVATGLPAMTLARPVGYAAGVAQGRVEPTGPVDAARGAITGTASPDSKQR